MTTDPIRQILRSAGIVPLLDAIDWGMLATMPAETLDNYARVAAAKWDAAPSDEMDDLRQHMAHRLHLAIAGDDCPDDPAVVQHWEWLHTLLSDEVAARQVQECALRA